MIVKTDGYTRDQVGKVVNVRANVEGLRLGAGVLDKLAAEGERSSLRCVFRTLPRIRLITGPNRYVLQLLTPASILATLAGRTQIELEDIGEMTELFLDAKTSAAITARGNDGDGERMHT
jgi:DNA helicase TIP49, TBP-interacting protein